jgi:hypothetical protein
MRGGSARARALAEGAVLAALLALGAVREHAAQGVELSFLALGIVLAGAFFRLVLVGRERIEPAPIAVRALELAAFLGFIGWSQEAGLHLNYPIARTGLGLAGLAALARAWPPFRASERESPRATPLEEAAVAAGALVAAFVAWRTARAGLPLTLFVIAALALEAWGPFAGRSVEDAARRAAAFALAGAAALIYGRESQHIGILDDVSFILDTLADPRATFVPDALLLALAALLVPLVALEVVARGLARRTAVERAARRRGVIARTALVLATLALVWIAGEVLFRVLPAFASKRDVTLGSPTESSWHDPGKRYVYLGPPLGHREEEPNEFVWNKDGFHDADHELEKPKGCARVVVLGDSYVDAVQIPLDDCFHRRLARELAPATPPPRTVEALGFGWSGWGQVQELEALDKSIARYRPDLVVLEFLPANDVRNNHPALEDLANAPNHSLARRIQARAIARGLLFTAWVAERIQQTLVHFSSDPEGIDGDVYRESPPRAELWREAWERTDALIGAISEKCEKLGARLVVAIFTSPGEIAACRGVPAPAGYDLRLPARRMLEICRRRGVPCIDFAPRFAARGGPDVDRVHLRFDGHWSKVGHRWAAEETRRFLVDETPIWRDVIAR